MCTLGLSRRRPASAVFIWNPLLRCAKVFYIKVNALAFVSYMRDVVQATACQGAL